MEVNNILSLFDGMSCGQVALNKLGIKYNNYFASEIDKHAIKVTQHNFPNTIQLGDVTKIKGSELPKIDLLIGGSPCFTKGNLVMTNKGYVPIEEIKIGDMVLTHKNRYKKVINIGGEYKKTYQIKAQGSTIITTTHEHPFYCYKGGDFTWKDIAKFDKSDKVVSLKLKNIKDDESFSDIDLYILGRFLADGCCYKTKRKNRKDSYIYKFKISVGKHELEDFKKKVDDRFNYIEERTVYNAFIYSKEWVEIGKTFGHLAHNKYIPNYILDLPIERLKIFIDGYMDGDGTLRKNGFLKAVTVSEKLALTLSLAIQKCYNGLNILKIDKPKKYKIENRIVNQRDVYEIYYKKDICNNSRYKVIEDYISYKLTKSKIKETNKLEQVFNIEVEDDNSYVVNNLIVHNCQGFSFSGKQLNFEDPRSKLFFEFVRLVKECKPKYWLLENVVMKQEYQDVISEHLGTQPIRINSSLVSAQNRERLYWTNIPNISQPEDKNVRLIDILESVEINGEVVDPRYLNKATIIGRRLNNLEKREDYNKNIPITQCLEVRASNVEKSNCITTVAKDNVLTTLPIGRHVDAFKNKLPYRYYTIKEYCRLQNVPDDYFDGVASDNQIRKMIGNGWTVDVIVHIFKEMFSNKNI